MSNDPVSWRRNRGLFLLLPVSLFLIFSLYMLISNAADTRFSRGGERSAYPRRDSHVTVIFPESRQGYYSRIRAGLEQFLEDEGGESIGFQYMTAFPFMGSEESMYRQSEISILAGVDGIVIAPGTSEELSELLTRSRNQGIPVVALNNSLSPETADTVVGVDSFLLGVRLGEISVEFLDEPSSGYFIAGTNTLVPDSEEFISGLRASFFAANRGVPINIARLGERDIFARETIEQVLNRIPEVNFIIADSPEVTLNLAQAVVENNLVGQALIIGVDGLDEIQEYFRAGIISYLISINPNEVAIKTVEAMRTLLNGGEVDPRIPVNVRIVAGGEEE